MLRAGKPILRCLAGKLEPSLTVWVPSIPSFHPIAGLYLSYLVAEQVTFNLLGIIQPYHN